MIENFGTITVVPNPNATPGTTGQAVAETPVNVGPSLPANANRNVFFGNEPGAVVNGNLVMGNGNNTVELFSGSTVTGNLSGGPDPYTINGVTNQDTLILNAATAPGTLGGTLTNFDVLTKTGPFAWEITGALSNTRGSLAAEVQQGTLTLTGENTNFTGTMTVNNGAVLQIGRGGTSGSFAAPITDNGIVAFNRSDALTHSNVISGSGQVGQIGTGTLILTGNNTYTGGTFINSGTLNVSSDGSSMGNPLGALSGPLTFNAPAPINTTPNPTSPPTFQFGASFDLDPTRAITINPPGGTFDTQGFTSTIAQGITGAGALTKAGTGTLTLTGNNPYTGGTTVAAGTLAVGDAAHPDAALSGGGNVAIMSGATLGGYGSVTGAVTNDGTIAAGNALSTFAGGPVGNFMINGNLVNSGLVNLAGTAVGNQLTVVGGNYVGAGGTLQVNTVLGSDGSPSDKLVISGGIATGSTPLKVNNFGGTGALTVANGIQVVQAINGGTTTPTAFSLAGGRVTAGAFDYFLFRGGVSPGTQDSWFLRSSLVAPPTAPPIPLFNPEVPLKSVVPSVARTLGLVTLGTFNERQGDQLLVRGDPNTRVGAWGRVFGQGTREQFAQGARPDFDGTFAGFQAGADLLRLESSNGHSDHIGFYVGQARASGAVHGSVDGFDGAPAGHVDLDATSFGGYWTHLGPSNWYIDAVLQGTYFQTAANSIRGVANNFSGGGFAASIEGGYPIPLVSWLTFEPQIQGIWQRTSFDDTLGEAFSTITFDRSNVFTGRVGALLRGTFGSTGAVWQPYLKGNVWWGSNGFDTVTFNGVGIQTGRNGGTTLEGGGGVTGKLARNVSVYGDASYLSSVSGESRITLKGNVGLRVTW